VPPFTTTRLLHWFCGGLAGILQQWIPQARPPRGNHRLRTVEGGMGGFSTEFQSTESL